MSTNTRTNSPSGGLRQKFAGALIACLMFLRAAPLSAERVVALKARGYVNDFAAVLNEQTRQQLTALCTEVDQKSHAQIAVVTIHTFEGLEAADFANRLFKHWGVGHKDDNRGVLVLLAVADHKYWVEVGYGLEPILPDGKVGGFGREMVTSLRAGDYNGGLLHLTSEIADVVARDRGITLSSRPPPGPSAPPPPSTTSPQSQAHSGPDLFASIFLVALILLFVFLVVVTRGRILWWLLFSILLGSRGGSSWSSGGGFGGGGGGFGGFGGGASGGGGAGGSW